VVSCVKGQPRGEEAVPDHNAGGPGFASPWGQNFSDRIFIVILIIFRFIESMLEVCIIAYCYVNAYKRFAVRGNSWACVKQCIEGKCPAVHTANISCTR